MVPALAPTRRECQKGAFQRSFGKAASRMGWSRHCVPPPPRAISSFIFFKIFLFFILIYFLIFILKFILLLF